MPSHSELVLQASAVNIDHTLAKYNNDSVLEQAVIYAQQHVVATTGTASTKAPTAQAIARVSGGANV